MTERLNEDVVGLIDKMVIDMEKQDEVSEEDIFEKNKVKYKKQFENTLKV